MPLKHSLTVFPFLLYIMHSQLTREAVKISCRLRFRLKNPYRALGMVFLTDGQPPMIRRRLF
jgi:hypothetical protein